MKFLAYFCCFWGFIFSPPLMVMLALYLADKADRYMYQEFYQPHPFFETKTATIRFFLSGCLMTLFYWGFWGIIFYVLHKFLVIS